MSKLSHHGKDEGKTHLFAQVWRQCRSHVCSSTCGGDCSLCRPGPWITSQIIRLAEAEPNKPASALAPAIQQLLLENRYVNVGGEPIIAGHALPQLDRQVALIVETIETMRRQALHSIPGTGASASPPTAG